MPSLKDSLSRHRWLPLPVLGGAVMVFASIVIGTATWSEWFTYSGPPRTHSTYDTGAALFRMFMAIGGLALIVLPWLIVRIAPHDEDRIAARRTPVLSRELWGVLALMMVALVLAATRLTESLWYDEIAPWMEYIRYGPGVIVGNYFDPSNHIFMSLLVWASTEALGDSVQLEIAFRLPALLAFLATIPVLYALGRVLCGAQWGALLALLGALAPVIMLEGVEARGYAIMLFASSAMMRCFALGARGRPGAWVWYAIIAPLGIWAHFVTAFLPIGHAAWLLGVLILSRGKRDAISGLVAIALAGLLTLALYAPVLPDFLHLAREQGSFGASATDKPTLFGVEGLHLLLQLGGSWAWWASLIGLALVVGTVVRSLAQREGERDVVLASLLGGVLLITTVLITGAWVYARFALFLMPAALLAMMLALRWIASIDRRLFAAALFVLIVPWLTDLARRPPKQPLRDAVEFIAMYGRPGQGVLGVGLFHGVIRIYFPHGDPTWQFTTHAEDDFESMLATLRPQWVIVYYPHLLSGSRATLLDESGYTITSHLSGWADWGKGDVVVWEKREAASGG